MLLPQYFCIVVRARTSKTVPNFAFENVRSSMSFFNASSNSNSFGPRKRTASPSLRAAARPTLSRTFSSPWEGRLAPSRRRYRNLTREHQHRCTENTSCLRLEPGDGLLTLRLHWRRVNERLRRGCCSRIFFDSFYYYYYSLHRPNRFRCCCCYYYYY